MENFHKIEKKMDLKVNTLGEKPVQSKLFYIIVNSKLQF
mgnify:FL=1